MPTCNVHGLALGQRKARFWIYESLSKFRAIPWRDYIWENSIHPSIRHLTSLFSWPSSMQPFSRNPSYCRHLQKNSLGWSFKTWQDPAADKASPGKFQQQKTGVAARNPGSIYIYIYIVDLCQKRFLLIFGKILKYLYQYRKNFHPPKENVQVQPGCLWLPQFHRWTKGVEGLSGTIAVPCFSVAIFQVQRKHGRGWHKEFCIGYRIYINILWVMSIFLQYIYIYLSKQNLTSIIIFVYFRIFCFVFVYL